MSIFTCLLSYSVNHLLQQFYYTDLNSYFDFSLGLSFEETIRRQVQTVIDKLFCSNNGEADTGYNHVKTG